MSKRDTRVQIIIIENGKYILLKHWFKRENRTFWGFPGGGIEKGETCEKAAIRETYEETGLKIKLLPIKIKSSPPFKNSSYKKIITFMAYPIEGEAKVGCEPETETPYYELLDIKWHDFYDNNGIDPIIKMEIRPFREFLDSKPYTQKAGALVYKIENDKIKYLFVSTKEDADKFIFPQGHNEIGETSEKTAIRETKEETGIEIKIEKNLGFFFYEEMKKEEKEGKTKEIFQTHIFLASFIKDCVPEENRLVKWFDYEEIKNLEIYRESRKFIDEVNEELTELTLKNQF